MANVQVVENMDGLVSAAAEITCRDLNAAIEAYGQATWVLAGGTAPALVYREIAERYHDQVRWQKVFVVMGDERCVPADHPDSNWGQAQAALFDHLPIPLDNLLQPDTTLPPEAAAEQYAQALLRLSLKAPGLPRLNHLWLGLGEDGHTLSLFPGQPALALGLDAEAPLVTAVHDSPKPPSDRLSLTLRALRGVETCLIMAVGPGKAQIVDRALAQSHGQTSQDTAALLPIAQAVQTIEAAGGEVTWLLDTAAAPTIA